MKRKLFCEIHPITYKISLKKEVLKRNISDIVKNNKFSLSKDNNMLPFVIIKHKSLIRRKLNNVDIHLQENKSQNLKIAAPKINRILIRPGEIFSFWRLVGKVNKKNGYLDGVVISNGKVLKGVGGGMCQFTNLLHWMFLHTELDIIERHHHNGLDLFPDFNRQIPFGTGTSISYNNIDYRVKNNTQYTYQIIVYTTEEHLCGEIRVDKETTEKIHIREEEAYFFRKNNNLYRHNKIYRKVIDKKTGNIIEDKMIMENVSKTLYSEEFIDKDKIIEV